MPYVEISTLQTLSVGYQSLLAALHALTAMSEQYDDEQKNLENAVTYIEEALLSINNYFASSVKHDRAIRAEEE